MIAIKGRRKCLKCSKRYNWYYSKTNKDIDKVKFKGKEENSCNAKSIKIMSVNNYEVSLNCPECGAEEKFIYTD